jgi:periplasmic copper chaperone A
MPQMKSTFRIFSLGALTVACLAGEAQQPLRVEGAWVRGTVSGQQGTAAFMKLTATEPVQLVGVSTPIAGVAELHEMKLVGEVMRMRAVASLDLPAGQSVELKPGGYHLMLQDLKQPLPPGSTVPLTLRFRSANGVESKLDMTVPVALRPPAAGAIGPTKAGKPDGRATDGHKH